MAANASEPPRTPGPTSRGASPVSHGTHRAGGHRAGDGPNPAPPIEPSFRHFAESLWDLVWSARPDGHSDYYNRRFLEFLGRTADEMGGWTWAEMLHPDDADAARRAWEQASANGDDYEVEFRMRRHDGVYRWLRSHGSPMRDGSGRITRWFGTCTDVDDRKRVDEALRASEERFSRFMQHLPGLAWIKDSQGRYVYANDDALRAFGVDRGTLYGRTDEEVFPPDTAAAFRAHDRRALESGSGIRVIETLEHGDGTVHHSLVSKFPIPSAVGGERLVGGMAIDITDRLEMEAALREADRRKDEFLATLAHELRNPLAPIRNALHLMARPAGAEGNPAHESERAMAARQVGHLARLIDDLMDVARISRGKFELRKQVVNLGEVAGQAVQTVRPLIDERRHRLTVSLPDAPIHLEADPTRLEQVLWNLLNNAAKYTPPGGEIALAVARDGDEAVVRVRDNGIGIEAAMLPRLFQMFVQVGAHGEQARGGLGIGLGLGKVLVEMHGGRVSARSAGPGTGSEFVVRLPALAADARATTVQEPAGGAGGNRPLPRRRILVVDDNADAANSLARLLARLHGQEVRVALDGPEALRIASEFRPEVVLLDIGLPGMDGHEVARRLRARPEHARTLLVALTGWGQEADRRKSQEAGIDHHLVKPVEPQTLQDLLSRPDRIGPA